MAAPGQGRRFGCADGMSASALIASEAPDPKSDVEGQTSLRRPGASCNLVSLQLPSR